MPSLSLSLHPGSQEEGAAGDRSGRPSPPSSVPPRARGSVCKPHLLAAPHRPTSRRRLEGKWPALELLCVRVLASSAGRHILRAGGRREHVGLAWRPGLPGLSR